MRVAGRLLTIHRVLVRYGLDDFVRATHLYRPLRFVFWLSPWTWFTRRRGTRGERLRRALEDLGPIFVKFGQVVSTRRDLLPPDIADELAKLQDRVPPFPGDAAKARIEAALGRPVARAVPRLRRRRRWPPPRSPRCTRRRCRTGARSSSRCCVPACARRSSATSRCCTRSRGSPRSTGPIRGACGRARSSSSTRRRS